MLYRAGFYRGGGVLMSAIAGIDQALWDIKGKFFNAPVYQLMGGACRDNMRVYSWIGGDRPSDVGAAALERKNAGFTAIKMNATEELQMIDTYDKVDAVLERVAAIRESCGKYFGIAIDFHGRVHKPMAKVLAKKLEEFDPMFIEEPVLCENMEVFKEIAAACNVKPVIRTFGLADSEGKINPQDLFRIEIKDLEEEIVPDEPEKPNPEPDDPDNPEKPTNGNFTIKVDVTLNETPIDITVPSGGENGGSTGGDDNTGGETDGVISIKGDAINTDLVVSVPNGISSFRVIIDSPLLPESELQGIGLTSDFDLVSPGGYADKLSGLGFPVHIGGETSVSFNISQFVPMLQILGSGTSNFHLTVTDSKGNTKTHTITITT